MSLEYMQSCCKCSVYMYVNLTVSAYITIVQCILMPEAVTVPSLMMTLTVSEESSAGDRHIGRQTHTHRHGGHHY